MARNASLSDDETLALQKWMVTNGYLRKHGADGDWGSESRTDIRPFLGLQPLTPPRPSSDAEHVQRMVAMYGQLQVRSWAKPHLERIVDAIRGTQSKYMGIETATGVPWMVVGAIHNMESSLNFQKHLHNGDPLTGRTTRVPAGRPQHGSPPFSWEESAIDALAMKGWRPGLTWDLANTLDRLERYNGLGYRRYHQDVPTPYVWSGSQWYEKGKYVADGKWDPNAVSKQIGAGLILKKLGYA